MPCKDFQHICPQEKVFCIIARISSVKNLVVYKYLAMLKQFNKKYSTVQEKTLRIQDMDKEKSSMS